ncbi:MAG: manganese efflux pump [Ruminococcaceae bacterium]|nr:manganese efflux pump [Oscillospiraceae bacterium]
MVIFEIILLSVGLAMDAFAVAVCKGLAMKEVRPKNALIVGLWFGGFQMLMPFIGYFLGSRFQKNIESIDHWIAFGLLALIGINMIREALSKECGEGDASLGFKKMFVLSVATSIDALAVGIALAMDNAKPIYIAAPAIGIITLGISFMGVYIGSIFGMKYKSKAEFAGGLILILLGTKILLDHLGIL